MFNKSMYNKNVSIVHIFPIHTIICSVDHEIGGQNSNLALKLERSYHREHVYQVSN